MKFNQFLTNIFKQTISSPTAKGKKQNSQSSLEEHFKTIKTFLIAWIAQENSKNQISFFKLLNPLNWLKLLKYNKYIYMYSGYIIAFVVLSFLWFFPPIQSIFFLIPIVIIGLLTSFSLMSIIDNLFVHSNFNQEKFFKGIHLFMKNKQPVYNIQSKVKETNQEIQIEFYHISKQERKLIYSTSFDHGLFTIEQVQSFVDQIDNLLSNVRREQHLQNQNASYSKKVSPEKMTRDFFNDNRRNKYETITYSFNKVFFLSLCLLSFIIFISGIILKINNPHNNYIQDQIIHNKIKNHKFTPIEEATGIQSAVKDIQNIASPLKNEGEHSSVLQNIKISNICAYRSFYHTALIKYELKGKLDRYYYYVFSNEGKLIDNGKIPKTLGDSEATIIETICDKPIKINPELEVIYKTPTSK